MKTQKYIFLLNMITKTKINIIMLILGHLIWSTKTYSQVNVRQMPLFLHGIYQVEKILIYPPISSWHTKAINTQHLSSDTTDITYMIKEDYGLIEPISIVLRDSTVQVCDGNSILAQEIFGFLQTSVIPYEIDNRPSKPGYFTFHLPIRIDDKSAEEILVYFPYTSITYNRLIRVVNPKGDIEHHQMLIKATHIYRVDFYDHSKFVPLIVNQK